MTIQTENAVVPFQGIIQPIRSIDHRILRYSEGDKYLNDKSPFTDEGLDQTGIIYGRYGQDSTGGHSLGGNIDIYI